TTAERVRCAESSTTVTAVPKATEGLAIVKKASPSPPTRTTPARSLYGQAGAGPRREHDPAAPPPATAAAASRARPPPLAASARACPARAEGRQGSAAVSERPPADRTTVRAR